MLYIDSPDYTGYSHSTSPPRIKSEDYGADLFEFVKQFYKLFPGLRTRDLYVGGQSYAGKYVAVLAEKIHMALDKNETDIPMKGIYLSGPLFSPKRMLSQIFEALYVIGLISKEQKINLTRDANADKTKYSRNEINGTYAATRMLNRIEQFNISFENFVTRTNVNRSVVDDIMRSTRIRSAVHAGNGTYETCNKTLRTKHFPTFLSDTRTKLKNLLENGTYKVLVVNGNYDLLASNPMIEDALLAINWENKTDYRDAGREQWKFPNKTGHLYGYYSKVGTLCRVTIDGAGHRIAHDKLDVTRELMLQFTKNGCVE